MKSVASHIVLFGLAAAVSVGACSRTHLTATHGRAYREVFAAQDANPNRKGSGKSVHGLDSQEAAIIAGSYRKALAPQAAPVNGQNQLLMISPQRPADTSAGLPASVPAGQ